MHLDVWWKCPVCSLFHRFDDIWWPSGELLAQWASIILLAITVTLAKSTFSKSVFHSIKSSSPFHPLIGCWCVVLWSIRVRPVAQYLRVQHARFLLGIPCHNALASTSIDRSHWATAGIALWALWDIQALSSCQGLNYDGVLLSYLSKWKCHLR